MPLYRFLSNNVCKKFIIRFKRLILEKKKTKSWKMNLLLICTVFISILFQLPQVHIMKKSTMIRGMMRGSG
jgi:hypothetical protein